MFSNDKNSDNKEEKFIKRLYAALDEPQIQEKMRKVMSNAIEYYALSTEDESNIRSAETENKRLRSELKAEQKTVAELKEKISSLEKVAEDDRKIKQILEFDARSCKLALSGKEKQLADAYKELGQYRDIYAEPERIYGEYMKLDPSLRQRLSGMISDKSAVAFISSCSRKENLEALWDYIKTLLMTPGSEDAAIPVLSEIFDYFFDLFNESSDKPVYVRSSVNIGARFDDEQHIRGREGKAQGRIKEVLLLGYSSVNTGNAVRKSVVIAN